MDRLSIVRKIQDKGYLFRGESKIENDIEGVSYAKCYRDSIISDLTLRLKNNDPFNIEIEASKYIKINGDEFKVGCNVGMEIYEFDNIDEVESKIHKSILDECERLKSE